MKWVLVGSLCLFCSTAWVRGQDANAYWNQGLDALNNAHYDEAAKDFQTIVTSYPTFQQIDNAQLFAGRAYFYAKKYTEAVNVLQKESAATAKPEFRGQALFLTGLSQFSAAQDKTTDKSVDTADFTTTAATFSTLIDFISHNSTPENKALMEQSIYFRSLSYYEIDKYDEAVKDLITLTTDPTYGQSLSRPDYLLQLGTIYSIQSSAAKDKDQDQGVSLAKQSIGIYDQVINDPNALVQANKASMQKAQVYVMLAVLNNNSSDGYQQAVDAYRKVRRKADLIPAQQARLQQLRALAAQIAQQNAANHAAPGTTSNQLELVINREQAALDELMKADSPDPIIDALIGMAQCYININGADGKKESDEARTILHRLIAHAKLTPDQQKTVDFNVLFSYVLGGQTDKADAALTDYLKNHAGDPQADFISFEIATELMKHKDWAGALKSAQRSIQDFPKGRYVTDAIVLEASALTSLGKIDDSKKVVDDFLKNNPNSPQAYSMLLTRGANEVASGDLAGALPDFAKVKDATAAGPQLQAGAAASYIQTLSRMQKWDQVIPEAKTFQAKYPDSTALSAVMLFAAQAQLAKGDLPGGITALQDVARKFPQDPVVAPIALFTVVDAYRKAGNITLMLQAAKDLQTQAPKAYPQILMADEAVSTVLQAQRPPRFDDAAALYQSLASAPDETVAAAAQDKVADVYFAHAKSFHYQSMPTAGPNNPPGTITREDAKKVLGQAESAYLTTLKNFPNQLGPVGDAIDGLVNVAERNRSWGVFKDDTDYEPYLTDISKSLTSPDMQARFEMAKAGLVFIVKNGTTQYSAALDRYRKVVAANSSLALTRQEADQFGQLLLAAKDYDMAQKVYQQLLDNTPSNDAAALAVGYYGLGATAMLQNHIEDAKLNFGKMLALPGGAAWNKNVGDAQYGIAFAEEQSGTATDMAAAKVAYGPLMNSMLASNTLKAKAKIGYGRILEKQGSTLKAAANANPNENAVFYYLQVPLFFSTGTPEQSAEGLYLAGQIYDKAGDKVNAKKQYDLILSTYKDLAPDWAAKAAAAEAK